MAKKKLIMGRGKKTKRKVEDDLPEDTEKSMDAIELLKATAALLGHEEPLEKAKYIKRWKGSDGKWRYQYKREKKVKNKQQEERNRDPENAHKLARDLPSGKAPSLTEAFGKESPRMQYSAQYNVKAVAKDLAAGKASPEQWFHRLSSNQYGFNDAQAHAVVQAAMDSNKGWGDLPATIDKPAEKGPDKAFDPKDKVERPSFFPTSPWDLVNRVSTMIDNPSAKAAIHQAGPLLESAWGKGEESPAGRPSSADFLKVVNDISARVGIPHTGPKSSERERKAAAEGLAFLGKVLSQHAFDGYKDKNEQKGMFLQDVGSRLIARAAALHAGKVSFSPEEKAEHGFGPPNRGGAKKSYTHMQTPADQVRELPLRKSGRVPLLNDEPLVIDRRVQASEHVRMRYYEAPLRIEQVQKSMGHVMVNPHIGALFKR